MDTPDILRSRANAVILAVLLLAVLLLVAFPLIGQAQSAPGEAIPPVSSETASGGGQSTAGQQPDGSIHGTVEDTNGNALAGAVVTLAPDAKAKDAKAQDTRLTGLTGAFSFAGLKPGVFRITVKSPGLADWAGTEIALPPGKDYEMPTIVLRVAPTNVEVKVVFTRYELAEEQVHAQEQQRILGVFPNFYTSYIWNAVPLTSGQKFRLALRDSIDPVTFLTTGATAGIEQWQNYFSGYGQGSVGYAKRFAASYTDGFTGTMIGGAILPSLLHQDPRYFYKGTGSIASRALYAISTVVICKGDNGHWQPNFSSVLGNIASAGLSNLYYPASNRNGAGVTIDNALIGTAEGAFEALLQEFLLRKISRGIKQAPSPPSPQP